MSKALKPRKCKICGTAFDPRNSLQRVCSPRCALDLTNKQKAKQAARELREGRERLKTKGDYAREAQAAFNAFIRARDMHLPCISCGRFHEGAYDAGHYRSVGAAPELRFHEDNCHRQCVPCNQHKSGNAIEYRIRLVDRIGAARVEFLEGPQEPKHYTIDDLKSIKATYRAKLKAMKAENERKAA